MKNSTLQNSSHHRALISDRRIITEHSSQIGESYGALITGRRLIIEHSSQIGESYGALIPDRRLIIEHSSQIAVHEKVISDFQALHQGRASVAGFEPAALESLQTSGSVVSVKFMSDSAVHQHDSPVLPGVYSLGMFYLKRSCVEISRSSIFCHSPSPCGFQSQGSISWTDDLRTNIKNIEDLSKDLFDMSRRLNFSIVDIEDDYVR
ncbi:hypothetical protein PoB_002336500 [Plakobranchus ocellatus]|uniref:Uncharacterized protein n=1 Tax=Plakobranchus ocellatus TaxID=259542 RepID=A0AAV3ZMF8_9GAST|nr:hypothetical protein PoB_002336500 [Plakobranchus ocellatus]